MNTTASSLDLLASNIKVHLPRSPRFSRKARSSSGSEIFRTIPLPSTIVSPTTCEDIDELEQEKNVITHLPPGNDLIDFLTYI